MIAKTLKAEALAILLGSIYWFSTTGYSWWMFVGLLLVPDISMAGYLKGPRIGAVAYNLGHSYALPLALLTIGSIRDHRLCVALAIIWIAHIAMDRLLGYGLKSTKGFKQTHLGELK